MTEEEKKYQKELWKQDRILARREEWKKIRKLGPGARLQYFWDYYKFVLVIAAACVIVVYLTVTMIQGARTHTLLYVCFLNTDALDPDTETLQEDYIENRGGLEKNEEMVFDSSVFIDPNASGTSQRDVAASIKITSYVGAGTLDAFLAPSDVTVYEQENGMLLQLEKILSEEEIASLSESGRLYYEKEPETEVQNAERSAEASLNTQAGDGMHIYAVRVDDADVLRNYDIYAEDKPVWFSVIGNSDRTEEAARFLRFLLGQEE